MMMIIVRLRLGLDCLQIVAVRLERMRNPTNMVRGTLEGKVAGNLLDAGTTRSHLPTAPNATRKTLSRGRRLSWIPWHMPAIPRSAHSLAKRLTRRHSQVVSSLSEFGLKSAVLLTLQP